MSELRPYQVDLIARVQAAYREGAQAVCAQSATGSGKCLGLGTPVLRFDGTIVPVEAVRPGDLLMGPDSRPRRVLGTTRGRSPLYRIVPLRGAPWVCNDVHVLTLVRTETGAVIDVDLPTYLGANKSFRHLHKQFTPPDGIEFEPASPLPLDPYFVGVWFGDGTRKLACVAVSKPDEAIAAIAHEIAAKYGLRVRTSTNKSCPTHRIAGERGQRNELLRLMREINGDGTALPHAYLTASRDDRKAFLAGLLDTDGYMSRAGYEIVQLRRGYADGIAFLARSLGLHASITPKVVNSTTYWRVHISGDCSGLPLRITRKMAPPRRQKKCATRTGFAVEAIGEGEYAGFELDGDGRFLLGDFTVTHNTHMAAAGIIAPSLARGRRTLFLADLEEIILDTTARLRALGLPAAAILDGRAEDPTAPVQVASQQTLAAWMRRGVDLPPADRVILDECHGAPAATTRAMLAVLRGRGALLLGLTATPARGDGQALSEFDRLVCGPTMRQLVAAGALVPAEVYSPDRYLERGIAQDPAEVVLRAGRQGGRCVAFVATAAEAQRVAAAVTAAGQTANAVLDSTPKATRRLMRARAERGDVQHLVTVRALQKGFDLPLLDTAVLASGGGTITGWLQSIGRVLRAAPGKTSARVYDLRGWVYLHGMPDADRVWSLEGRQGRTGEAAPSLRRCRDCHAVFAPAIRCPRCGSTLIADPRPQRIQRAELYAQSGVPADLRARRYLAAIERAMVGRGMPPQRAAVIARQKAPAWVSEALNG